MINTINDNNVKQIKIKNIDSIINDKASESKFAIAKYVKPEHNNALVQLSTAIHLQSIMEYAN